MTFEALSESTAIWGRAAWNWVKSAQSSTVAKIRNLDLGQVVTNVGRLTSLSLAYAADSAPVVATVIGVGGLTISEFVGYAISRMKGNREDAQKRLPRAAVLCAVSVAVTAAVLSQVQDPTEAPLVNMSSWTVSELLDSPCSAWCGCPGF